MLEGPHYCLRNKKKQEEAREVCIRQIIHMCIYFKYFYYYYFLTDFNLFIFSHIKASGSSYSWNLGSLHGDSGVGFHKMVSKFLLGRLAEDCLFPDISHITVGLRDGIKIILGEVDWNSSVAPD